MGVSLLEVLENAGYDIKYDPADASWLLAQKDEFEELCEKAEETRDLYDNEYSDYLLDLDLEPCTFYEWRKRKEEEEQ